MRTRGNEFYGSGVIKNTAAPNIDAIRNTGLSFNNVWVYPTCTPTRSSILTGKYGYRTSVKWASDKLAQSEEALQKYISDRTNNSYASAIVGKWHLSGNNNTANPESYGIDYYAGLIRGAVTDYSRWEMTEDGSTSIQTTYTSEFFTDLSTYFFKLIGSIIINHFIFIQYLCFYIMAAMFFYMF